MDALFHWLASTPHELKSLGTDVLLIGVAGEIVVLFVPSRWRIAEKAASAFFVLLVIVGIWIEHVADDWLSAPRTLSEDAANRVINKIKAFAGTPFDFAINASPEPQSIAKRLGEALERAGWKWQAYSTSGMSASFPGKPRMQVDTGFVGLGVEIDAKANDLLSPFHALADALNDEKLNATANIRTDIPLPTAIHIYVGIKE
jgi:hypothetical protein